MIDSRFVRFFRKHHVLTVATSVNGEPWCANCFYVYLEDENAIVFTTDAQTRHGKEFVLNPKVSGTVVLETMVIGKIQGIQFSGIVSEPTGELHDKCRLSYLKRFPVASLMDTHIWMISLSYLKMTDNTFGFGKKLIWEEAKAGE